MAGRTLSADAHAWARVAERVHARRQELGLTADKVPGVSASLVSLIENERKDFYSVAKLTALSQALGWPADGIERILAGREPTDDAEQLDLRQEVELLRKELEALRSRLEEQGRI